MQNPSLLPAFPVPSDAAFVGLSSRDWFAAVALQGISAKGLEVSGDRMISEDEKNMILAKRAYAMADAMIAVGQATAKKIQVADSAKPSDNAKTRRFPRSNRHGNSGANVPRPKPDAPPSCDTTHSPESSV